MKLVVLVGTSYPPKNGVIAVTKILKQVQSRVPYFNPYLVIWVQKLISDDFIIYFGPIIWKNVSQNPSFKTKKIFQIEVRFGCENETARRKIRVSPKY